MLQVTSGQYQHLTYRAITMARGQLVSILFDKATDISIAAKQILRTRQQMNQIMAERTGQPLERIEKDTDRDYYMSAQEAQEYGLIDRVIEEKPF